MPTTSEMLKRPVRSSNMARDTTRSSAQTGAHRIRLTIQHAKRIHAPILLMTSTDTCIQSCNLQCTMI